jgi:hypothetical protein
MQKYRSTINRRKITVRQLIDEKITVRQLIDEKKYLEIFAFFSLHEFRSIRVAAEAAALLLYPAASSLPFFFIRQFFTGFFLTVFNATPVCLCFPHPPVCLSTASRPPAESWVGKDAKYRGREI